MFDQHSSAWQLLVCGSGEQQQVSVRILDDEILGALRLLFQRLVKGNTSGLKLKKQQLDLVCCSDSHGYRQQFLPVTNSRLDYCLLDAPEIEMRRIATHLCIVKRFAITEYKSKA